MDNMFEEGYFEGKDLLLDILKNVLAQMKSKEDTITAQMMNQIFDEVYAKVLHEIEETEK